MPSSVTKQSKSGSTQVSLRIKHIDHVFWKVCYPFVSEILSSNFVPTGCQPQKQDKLKISGVKPLGEM